MIIYTIGFTKKSAEEFFKALRNSKAKHLLDIRLNNKSQLTGFTKRDDLRYFLKRLVNMEYHEIPELAPEESMLKEYRKTKDWGKYTRSYIELIKNRQSEKRISPKLLEEGIVLLCSEPKADHCHRRLAAECLAAYDYEPSFDVIAYSAIAARKLRDPYDYEGCAHSLWFCDAHDEGVYRWYEIAFMVQPLIPERCTLDPFALPPTDENAAQAFTPVMGVRQIAWQPLPFDQGDEEQFIERWLSWFAAAVDETLRHHSHMPEQLGGKYRPPRRRGH